MILIRNLERSNLTWSKDKKVRCLQFQRESTPLSNSVTLNSKTKAGAKATSMTKMNKISKKRNSKIFTKEQIRKTHWNRPGFRTISQDIHPNSQEAIIFSRKKWRETLRTKAIDRNRAAKRKVRDLIVMRCWKSTDWVMQDLIGKQYRKARSPKTRER